MSNPKSYYHARSGHEAKDVIRAWGLNFALGNAVKYIARAGLKNEETAARDIQKAIDYLQDELNAYNKEQPKHELRPRPSKGGEP